MFLLVNKPKGITSHDVVDKIRLITGEKKVGHAGTLDPMATGLLIVAVGRQSTKKLSKLLKKDKEYIAEVVLGKETDTLDSEGDVVTSNEYKIYDIDTIEKVLGSFVGKIKQVPPKYSAIKIKGTKAYQMARQGKEVKLAARDVYIYSLDLLDYKDPVLKIKTKVSSGTYIRSLARDIGKILGCGAYLKELVRTSIGEYNLDDAISLKKLDNTNWKSFGFKL